MTQPDRTDIDRIQNILGQRYQLSWIIGRGGMSTVWLAWDTQEERDVAVKILKPEYTENAEFRSRFRNEAATSEEFHSPNVVTTYDYGEIRDPEGGSTFCYIILEYIRGESLADVLRREHKLSEQLTVDVMAQVAVGLQSIHEAGLVHRDIKPGNLLITPQGVVKITDFGIAKAAAAVPLTQTGMVVGTAQYVSPEQAQGNPVGPASDIYSLGVVAYEMVSGQRPFTGESTVSVAIKHISEAHPALPPNVSAPVRELIDICMRKDPRTRYSDGAELAAAIQYVIRGERPPNHVPPMDVDSAPFTEHLARVATDRGTAVPPLQGPREVSPQGAQAAHRSHPVSHDSRRQKSGTGPLIALGLVSALAIGVIAYLLLSDDEQPAPNPETLTVTNEVTNEPSESTAPWRPPSQAPTTREQRSSAPETTEEASPTKTTTTTTKPEKTTKSETPTSTEEDTPTNTEGPTDILDELLLGTSETSQPTTEQSPTEGDVPQL